QTTSNVVAYAYTSVDWQQDEDVVLTLGSVVGAKIWLNGSVVVETLTYTGYDPDATQYPVHLKKGANDLLVKVETGEGGWGFIARLVTKEQAAKIAVAQALQRAKLKYKPVFEGPGFPDISLDASDADQKTLGAYKLSADFYDAAYGKVGAPDKPGRYGALVTLTSGSGETCPFEVTLYKQPKPADWDGLEWKTFSEGLPEGLGLDPKSVQNRQEDLAYYLKLALQHNLDADPDAGVVLAGVSEAQAGDDPVERNNAWNRNNRWWLGLNQKLGRFQMRYLLDLPEGYAQDKKKAWPLLLYLHGSGERGDNLEMLRANGPPKLIQAGRKFPAIVVSPQCPRGRHWRPAELGVLLDKIAKEYRVDRSRVYCTGESMGGYASWAMAEEFPGRFAAIVPICGGGDPRDAARIKGTPVWAFHGGKDPWVPLARSQEMVDALKALGADARLTIYPELQHDAWTTAYNDEDLWQWLFKQQRGR
ncbi:MAG TPA: prolyl oligopeptidase family serine peptidase, partial [bacterium]|nr:prolyl oligopeptidase family serine peptidase [bacterium]